MDKQIKEIQKQALKKIDEILQEDKFDDVGQEVLDILEQLTFDDREEDSDLIYKEINKLSKLKFVIKTILQEMQNEIVEYILKKQQGEK